MLRRQLFLWSNTLCLIRSRAGHLLLEPFANALLNCDYLPPSASSSLLITEDERRHEEIAKEVIAQRSVRPNTAAPVNHESPVTHAQHFGLPRLADLNNVNSIGAVANRISLPEAEGIVADLGALREKRFRIIAPEGIVDEDEAVDEIDPNSWRISGLDFDTSTYNIVFGNIPNHPIQVHKDELFCLLMDSQLVQM